MNQFLKVKSISKNTSGSRRLLSSITFDFQKNERLAIVGETGSGKSTLLKSIGGLLSIDSGEIIFHEEIVEDPTEKLIAGHAGICYLSQHFELPKFVTVFNFLNRPEQIKVEDPELIYEACKVKHLLERDTRALSGGEKQRVALSKELLKAPDLLLLDEPFSNLDFNHKRIIREVLEEVEKDLNVTIIMVAHDPKDVLSWADQVMVMKKGEVVQFDTPELLYNRPIGIYVASLFGAYSLIPKYLDIPLANSFHTVDDQIFLRPHQVLIDSKGEHKGTVKKVRYFGSYDEVSIESILGMVITNTFVGRYQEGESVYFELN